MNNTQGCGSSVGSGVGAVTSTHAPTMGMVMQSVLALVIAVTLTDTIRDCLKSTKNYGFAASLMIRFTVCAMLLIIALVIILNYPAIDQYVNTWVVTN